MFEAPDTLTALICLILDAHHCIMLTLYKDIMCQLKSIVLK